MGILTDFFLPIATTYVGNMPYGKTPGTGVIGGGGITPAMPIQPAEFDVPFIDIIPDKPSGCGNPVYKKVCGSYRWVFPRRRRRKQLVTKSDAAGLATLKGILGNGQAMGTWIATHG